MLLRRIRRYRFAWLFCSLLILIASYPLFRDTATGTALGAICSLLVLGTGVRAIGPRRKTQVVGTLLALAAAATVVYPLVRASAGSLPGEIAFTIYYAFLTVAVFVEVLRTWDFDEDSILGIVSVYLLIGVAFGSGFDLLETIEPGSFLLNVERTAHDSVGFRQLLYFSFMTLTSVGYGDLTPVTDRAQSLVILEGVAGVIYVAVLVGGVVSAYRGSRADDV